MSPIKKSVASYLCNLPRSSQKPVVGQSTAKSKRYSSPGGDGSIAWGAIQMQSIWCAGLSCRTNRTRQGWKTRWTRWAGSRHDAKWFLAPFSSPFQDLPAVLIHYPALLRSDFATNRHE